MAWRCILFFTGTGNPHLLTGIRGYGPWLFVRVETAEGIVGWSEGTNFHGVQPIATAVGNLRAAVIGGQVHEKLRIYANGWNEGIPKTPEAYTVRTKELVAKGYTGCKFDPFSKTPMNREVTQADLRNAVAQVKAIREAGGPDFDIRH